MLDVYQFMILHWMKENNYSINTHELLFQYCIICYGLYFIYLCIYIHIQINVLKIPIKRFCLILKK